ncbi:MAG: YicC/YloC family endoribonuclease [Bacillota bacterium]|nr:YicC/YloC family endoribonuclease [Bacillota bacterium]
MINSMTGFGRCTEETEEWKVTAEVKSVNNRYLDVSVKMPKQFISLEENIKRSVSTAVSRGRVDVFLTIESTGERDQKVVVDKALALGYYNAVRKIKEEINIEDEIKLSDIASFYGVLTLEKGEDDLDSLWQVIDKAMAGALQDLCEMRRIEGQKLSTDILDRLEVVQELKNKIEERNPVVCKEHREKLYARISEILGEVAVDEEKLLNEVAFFADKADIAEEMTRLDSHIQQFKATMSMNEPVGRKLDFILQEINREINTTGSKANDTEISHLVIDAKSQLEKIREQIQNFE